MQANNLDDFLCALDIHHYKVEPVNLICGHAACYKCLNEYKETNGGEMVKCETCQRQRECKINYKDDQEDSTLNLTNLVKDLVKKYENEINYLKRLENEKSENIQFHIEYAKSEIEIRVESLKIQLNEIGQSMIKKLDDIKAEFEENKTKNEFTHDDFKNQLEILKEKIKVNSEIDEATLNEISFKRQNVQKAIKFIETIPPKVKLNVSNIAVDELMIGKIDYNFKDFLKAFDNKLLRQVLRTDTAT